MNTIKKLNLTKNKVSICIPLVGKNRDSIVQECLEVKKMNPDIIEWRADYLEDANILSNILNNLKEIKDILPEYPIIFTLRIKEEGGQIKIPQENRIHIITEVIKSNEIDFVDIEFINDVEFINTVMDCAKKNDVKVIISNHNFLTTPSKEEIYDILVNMQNLNCDVVKIAFMPNTIDDVVSQIFASNEFSKKYKDMLLISISMAKLGLITRIAAEVFGSCLTFCAGSDISASGQISISELRKGINLLRNEDLR